VLLQKWQRGTTVKFKLTEDTLEVEKRKTYRVNRTSGNFDFEATKEVDHNGVGKWVAEGHFSLQFSNLGEFDRFCAMRAVQIYELLLKAEALAKENARERAREKAREKVRLMQLPETYAVDGSSSKS
jgi:hypothetical protein